MQHIDWPTNFSDVMVQYIKLLLALEIYVANTWSDTNKEIYQVLLYRISAFWSNQMSGY